MAIQGFFTGDVKIRDLNGVLKTVDGIVEVATDAGTVTSVGIQVGSTGTDVNVANSPVTTSGNITLNLPTASATNRGLLSSADWTTFNAKQGAITLTTTGSSGAATLIGTTLNIPNYSGALTGYVPYTGATSNVDLGEYGLDTGFLNFDTTPTGTPTTQGTVYWDDSRSTLSLIMNGVTQHIGQDSFFYVKNSTGSSIPKGTSVRFNGTDGASGHLLIAPFLADGTYPSSYFMGVTAETIDNGGFGQVMNFGELEGIDTSIYTAGDLLYASSTVAGGFQTTAPSAPNNIVLIAAAVNSKNNGAIVVRPTYGSNINDDEGVLITSAANNQGLFYDSATGLWKNKSIATVLGYTPANAATTLTINGTTYDISANRTWNVGTVTSIGTSGPLTGGTITGSGTIGITQATTSTDGYLSSTDWNTFYNKQAAGSYITALTGEATATGPGSASVTLSTSAVTGKILTGLNLTGGGTIADTDSILQAFGKVQNQISGLAGGVTYQGVWNASTNTPTLTSSVGTKGYYYIVDVAGSTNLNGITDWKIGDWAIFNGSTWDKVDNTDAVSSVNGFTGAVSLTTSNIAEGSNLYYLDSRARLALSFTAGSGAYDNTTGVITIPTNTSQLTNGANFITLSSLSASSPLSYNSGSGAFSIQVANGSQNGYLSSSDWTTFNSKQNAITLTTTGSSGSSTLVGATLNVPTYTLSGLGGVPTTRQLTINGTAYDLSADRSWSVGTHTGSLTSGYIPKATGTTSLTDSLVYDTGSAVLIGTQTASSGKFTVYSSTADNHYQAIGSAPSFRFADTLTSPTYTGIVGLATASNHFIVGAAAGDMVLANNTTSSIGNFIFGTGTTERMRITPTGNVSINNTNNTYRFDVTGTVRFTGQLRLESTITDGTYTYTLPSATGTLALTSAIPANPVGGTGTTNYLPKFTGTSTIGNSVIQESSSSIGINVSPAVELHIKATSSWAELRIDGASGGGSSLEYYSNGTQLGDIYCDTSANMIFRNNGANERMRLNASGNLSIGNTNDTYKLDVSGTGRTTGATYLATGGGNAGVGVTTILTPNNRTHTFQIGSNDSGVSSELVLGHQGDGFSIFTSGGSGAGALTIAQGTTSMLNFGITGAATFSSSVTATQLNASISTSGAVGSVPNLAYFKNQGSGYVARIAIGDGTTSDSYISHTGGNSTATQYLGFGVNAYNQMVLTGAGNVGIGTTSPTEKLDVIGGAVAAGNGTIRTGITYSSLGLIGTFTNHDLGVITNGSERMRITSGGNVEINTGSIKTGEPDTGYGRAAVKIGARNTGEATSSAGHIPVNIDGTVYFINLYSSLP